MKLLCIAAVLVLVLLVATLGAAAAVFLRGGISARPEPSAAETAVARRLRSGMIPATARNLRNPVPPSAAVLADARAHFADHCASCHANDGSGDTPVGRGLYPRAPDMRRHETQDLTDGELFYIIENGVRLTGMPAWGEPGKEGESWRLVHLIRHLPQLTDEEKLEMKRLNPRGPEEWKELQEEERFLQGEELQPSPAGPPGGHHGH